MSTEFNFYMNMNAINEQSQNQLQQQIHNLQGQNLQFLYSEASQQTHQNSILNEFLNSSVINASSTNDDKVLQKITFTN